MTLWLYRYPPLLSGHLIKRYKRFFAEIELDTGEVITAHCPNTGPMTGVYQPGRPVRVSRSDNPKRKLAYTWELIYLEDHEPTWVGVNTNLPNRIIKEALLNQQLPELAGRYSQVRPEVAYGRDRKSRIDFLLTDAQGENPIYVEVKNTTWTTGRTAVFPDTVTTRGQKHLRELISIRSEAAAVMLYFINRGDCVEFAPGDRADPTYGELFREAIAAGGEILPYRMEVSPEGVALAAIAPIQPHQPPETSKPG
jgi:sugar fermentation stimulation protein A